MGVYTRVRKNIEGKITKFRYIRYALLDGTLKRESLGETTKITKVLAEEILADRKKAIRLGKYDMVIAKIPKLSEFGEVYINYVSNIKRNRPNSIRSTKDAIKVFLKICEDKDLSNYTAEDIDYYKQERLNKCASKSSINRELAEIKALFNYADRTEKFFGKNPVKRSGNYKVDNTRSRVMTPEERERFLRFSPKYMMDIFLIAEQTALRKGNVLKLKWEWVDFKNGRIQIPRTDSKSNKLHIVEMNSVVKEILKERAEKYRFSSPFVFPNKSNYKNHIGDIKKMFNAVCKKAGIPTGMKTEDGLVFHDIRRTASTRVIESGLDVYHVKELLGHSDVRVTERYLHTTKLSKQATDVLEKFHKTRQNHIVTDTKTDTKHL